MIARRCRRQPASDQTCDGGRHGHKSESVLRHPYQQLDLMAVDQDTFLRAKHRTFIGLTEGSPTLLASSSRLNFPGERVKPNQGLRVLGTDRRQTCETTHKSDRVLNAIKSFVLSCLLSLHKEEYNFMRCGTSRLNAMHCRDCRLHRSNIYNLAQ